MKPEDLFNSMEGIDEKILERSEEAAAGNTVVKKPGAWKRVLAIAAAVAAIVVVAGIGLIATGVLGGGKKDAAKQPDGSDSILTGGAESFCVGEAEIPEMPPCLVGNMEGDINEIDRNYHEARWELMSQLRTYGASRALSGVYTFIANSMPEFLGNANGENRVYSPLNIYMALGMLAETAAGETRDQILAALGTTDIEDLRARVDALWKATYVDNGAAKNILAASLWMRDGQDYVPTTIGNLQKKYHASLYSGDMSSAAYSDALRNWINDQTDNLLTDSVKEISFDPATVMALVTTICYRAKWEDEFRQTETGKFHAAGGDVDCTFMKETQDNGIYYWGEHFGAVAKYMDESMPNSDMLFILPDEGVSVDELLTDPEVLKLIYGGSPFENNKTVKIHFSVPKFDVKSDIDMAEGLKKLGIVDAWDGAKADFSSLTNVKAFVSEARHSARVQIDEEGVKAVAFSEIMMAGAMLPQEEEIDFVLDRPFLFVIRMTDNCFYGGEFNMAPLFIGIVANP